MLVVFIAGKIHDRVTRRKDQVYTGDGQGTIAVAENVHVIGTPVPYRPTKGDNVRVKATASSASATGAWVEGDAADREAVVLSVNADGSVDLEYSDNGEQESRVDVGRVGWTTALAPRPFVGSAAAASDVGGGAAAPRRRSRSSPDAMLVEEV